MKKRIIKEGYKEINELSLLADIVIKKIAEQNIEKIKNYFINKKEFNDFPSLDMSYDIIGSDREFVNKFIIIKPFIDKFLKTDYDITFKFKLTEDIGGDFNRKLKNSLINITFSKEYFFKILDMFNNTRDFSVNKFYIILKELIKNIVIHELQHAYDDFRSKKKYDTDKRSKNYYEKYKEYFENKDENKKMTPEQYKEYLNLPHEYWARFTDYADSKGIDFFKKENINKIIKDFMKSDIIEMDQIEKYKDKKILLKTLYKYWYLVNNK
jgi:hypothetical protein